MNINEMVAAEMEAYSEGAYADHGSARDSMTRFAETVRDECARHLELTRSDVLLMAGEMSAQELRSVMAVLSCIWKRMRPNVEFSGTPAALSPEAPLERRVGGAVPPAPTFGEKA